MKSKINLRVLTTLFILRVIPGISGNTNVSNLEEVSVSGSTESSAETPLSAQPSETPEYLSDSVTEKLTMPNANAHLQSIVGSSEVLQKLLRTRGFLSAEASLADPAELNKLLARFKPKQGRFDPAMLDMLSNLDNNQSGGGSGGSGSSNSGNGGNFIPSIFGNSQSQPEVITRRMSTSTEENSVIWSSTTKPESSRKRNRFSSKFKNNTNTNSQTLTTISPAAPEEKRYDHITDPNIRNHRLYDWEFETYKNFTHIDQAEDLMADESDPSPSVVAIAAPNEESSDEEIHPTGWIPKPGISIRRRPPSYITGPPRPISMEGSQLDSSGDLNDAIPTNTYVKLPSDSEEPKIPSSQNSIRPREPLRESSTENLIFRHSSTENRDRERFQSRYNTRFRDRFRSEENYHDDDKLKDFKPSPSVLSPPVFIDPDQDFFTSTIRNPADEKSSESNSFRPPPRKLKKHRGDFINQRNRNRNKGRFEPEDSVTDRSPTKTKSLTSTRSTNGKKYSHVSDEEYFRDRLERNPTNTQQIASFEDHILDRDRDPRPYPEDFEKDGKKYIVPSESSREAINPYRKSDRILNPGQFPSTSDNPSSGNSNGLSSPATQQASDNHPYFHPSMPFGPASNEMEFHRSSPDYHPSDDYQQSNNYQQPQDIAGDYHHNNNNVDTNYYNSQQDQNQNSPHQQYNEYDQNNPSKGDATIYAGQYSNQFEHPFGDESQVEHYGIGGVGGRWSNTYYILGGLIALSALTAFLLPALLSSMGRKGNLRNDLTEDEYVDENTSTASTNIQTFTKLKPTSTTQDPTADADLWSEIKGVYNDVVKIVRGDYGGIVDKLSGSSTTVGTKNKDKIGPNIVYRDELDDDADGDVDDELDDDFVISEVRKRRKQKDHHKKKDKEDENEDEGNKNKFKSRRGNSVQGIDSNGDIDFDGTSASSTSYVNVNNGYNSSAEDDDDGDDDGDGRKSISKQKNKKKSKTISSSINFVVKNNGPPIEQSTSRGLHNDTMATFYLGSNSYLTHGAINGTLPFTTGGSSDHQMTSASTEGFMGEWAKVQLIGN